ncbi:MAG: LytTR family DNA-binding domain-containing protein [Bacteroidota bacterium]|nr:LytTR family DNA-binding domain-containing protein [Bacteroidota bacterium]
MIKTILIEDERLIAEEFKKILRRVPVETELSRTFGTVRESIEYLSVSEAPDLIFSDVQLPDGLSFDIFNKITVPCPVVFITAYDEFIINAFEHNGIGYLLKPVDDSDVEKALVKYKALESHFNSYHSFVRNFGPKKRSRLMVKKGIENIALKNEDIVLIYTEDKLVFAMDKEGKKYIVDKKLGELELELDAGLFFRANRQYIVNVEFIKGYKTYDRVKLQVDLLLPGLNHHIVISQEMAPFFRKWISEL